MDPTFFSKESVQGFQRSCAKTEVLSTHHFKVLEKKQVWDRLNEFLYTVLESFD